jgi:hypothetical protein
MSWAEKSCPDHEPAQKPPELRRLLRRQRIIPASIDLKLIEICEKGAFFCPSCHKYQSTVRICGRCNREMKWCPPIF